MRKTAPISPDEKKDVIFLISLNHGFIVNPVNNIADLLLTRFGWSLDEGKVRAERIIELLLQEGIIEINRGGRELRSIHLKTDSDSASKSIPKPRLVKPKSAVLPDPKLAAVTPSTVNDAQNAKSITVAKRKFQQRKKGKARIKRQTEIVGERAEHRLHKLLLQLAEILKTRFPEQISNITVSRSGRHNPRKGKIDLQDRSGEDITVLLTVYDGGRHRKERLIYDAKNSRFFAAKFNNKIRILPGQEGAILKKAISTNKMRSDREITAEILQDMVSVKLIPADYADVALSELSEI